MAACEVEVSRPRSLATAAPTMIPGGGLRRAQSSREDADASHPEWREMDSKTDLLDAGGEDRSPCDSSG
jgi:hypothetical protein